MVQQHPDSDALAAYLRAQATEFLRAPKGFAAGGGGGAECAPALRRAARRIGATLHTFHSVLDPAWSTALRRELAWFSGVLAQERLHTATLGRLRAALHEPREDLGAAKAAALLERRLTPARGRAHSAVLEALGSARFHALADAVALLAGEVPLRGDGPGRGPVDGRGHAGGGQDAGRDGTGDSAWGGDPGDGDGAGLRAHTDAAGRRLAEAVAALPEAHPGTGPDRAPYPADRPGDGDAPWHQVRALLRLHRYALEALTLPVPPRLLSAARALDRHRDAAEAASVAAAAARTPRIAPATAYALGNLHAHQRHEVLAARHDFHQAWRSPAQPRTVPVPHPSTSTSTVTVP
ncbi:CHAD domain-containing protein [Streptomyces fragilis]|uniref:CHAD domain-containing protein n=1 Tax=Streptomyces fragilis TaxID=67301 RepID=A0ABV2YP17_9ACTN|nr:CHAD domain-containing protein [Streptomyces fragilis]